MRVVLISEVAPAVEGLSAMLLAEGHEPVALLCVRHDASRYTDMGELIAAAPPEIDIVMPAARDGIAPLLRLFEPDVALCIGFPWKIPPDALAVPRHGIVNGHPSLLPRYRGPSPVSWAVRNGEKEIGFTLHYMDAELDTGTSSARSASRSTRSTPGRSSHRSWRRRSDECFPGCSSVSPPGIQAIRRTRARRPTSARSSPSTHAST